MRTTSPPATADQAAARKARRNADSRRWNANEPARLAWRDMATAQFARAEAATNGYLVNNRGRAAGIDPWSLWSGPLARAETWASWELLRFWETDRRITLTEFRAQFARDDDDAEHLDWLDRADYAAAGGTAA